MSQLSIRSAIVLRDLFEFYFRPVYQRLGIPYRGGNKRSLQADIDETRTNPEELERD